MVAPSRPYSRPLRPLLGRAVGEGPEAAEAALLEAVAAASAEAEAPFVFTSVSGTA